MSSPEELSKARDDKWMEYSDFIHTVISPKKYREKVGRKLEYIDNWKDAAEQKAASEKADRLYKEWRDLHMQCHELGLMPTDAGVMAAWKQIPTPDGDRWVRATDEERKLAHDYQRYVWALDAPVEGYKPLRELLYGEATPEDSGS